MRRTGVWLLPIVVMILSGCGGAQPGALEENRTAPGGASKPCGAYCTQLAELKEAVLIMDMRNRRLEAFIQDMAGKVSESGRWVSEMEKRLDAAKNQQETRADAALPSPDEYTVLRGLQAKNESLDKELRMMQNRLSNLQTALEKMHGYGAVEHNTSCKEPERSGTAGAILTDEPCRVGETCYVYTFMANVREQPSMDAEIVKVLEHLSMVRPTDTVDGYFVVGDKAFIRNYILRKVTFSRQEVKPGKG